MPKKPRKFDAGKEVKAIARERVGRVKSARVIEPKSTRKSKYPRDPLQES